MHKKKKKSKSKMDHKDLLKATHTKSWAHEDSQTSAVKKGFSALYCNGGANLPNLTSEVPQASISPQGGCNPPNTHLLKPSSRESKRKKPLRDKRRKRNIYQAFGDRYQPVWCRQRSLHRGSGQNESHTLLDTGHDEVRPSQSIASFAVP